MLTMDKAVDQFGYKMCCVKELNNNYFSVQMIITQLVLQAVVTIEMLV